MDIKTAQAGIRTAKVAGDTAKTTIDKKKSDSGLYHEHGQAALTATNSRQFLG